MNCKDGYDAEPDQDGYAQKGTQRSMLPSICMSCCVAVRKLSILSQLMEWLHSVEIGVLLTRLSSASVSRRPWTAYKICE